MKALDLVFAARPLLLVPIWSIYLVSLHFHHDLIGAAFGLVNVLSLAYLTLLGAGACYINQVFDAASDRQNNKVYFLARGLVTERQLMLGFVLTGILALSLSLLVSNLFFLICVQLLAFSYFYSAPSLRLKDRPVAGLVANAWCIGFLISVSVYPRMSQHNAGFLGWDNPFYFFMAVGGIYLLTTIPDQSGDAASGKQTVAVVAGRGRTVLLAALWLTVAAVTAWNSDYLPIFGVAVMSVLVTLVSLSASSERFVLFAAKLPILLLTLLAGWYYPYYLIFIVVLVITTRIYYTRRLNISYPNIA
jgi:4-hydroxybenzoate polyprenyltransferase